MPGSDWITHREAAELLGVHVSLIPKMLRRGDLTSRRQRPALSRAQVLELAAARERTAAERERRRAERERRRAEPVRPRSPDDEHEWLLAPAAAAVLGCSEGALGARATRGQVPYTLHRGRRWYRLDLLELMLRARAARRTMDG